MALSSQGPVGAQLPDLFPTTTAAPGATTTTLLPPLESLTPPPTTAPPGATPAPTLLPPPGSTPAPTLLPAPGSAPAPPLLPVPTKTTRTTTFTTTPVPPRTPLRSTATTVPRSVATPPGAPTVVDEVEGGDPDAGFESALPFSPADEEIRAAGLDAELGGGGTEGQLTMMASVAAGLIAMVLLGVVGWLQAQVRRRPPLR